MACDSPYYVEIHWQPDKVPVPCGKCPPCQKRRVSQWAFRLAQQEKEAVSAFFITLTFDTYHVPISKNGFMTLDKREYQNFMKRLRKLHKKDDPKISYYACGEYGSKNWRPHYHAIIFNTTEDNIHAAWEKGDVHIGKVSGASVAYTLKYINKGKRIPMHANDDRLPEFSLMSKKMGLAYLSPALIQYHKNNLSRAYVTTEGGHKVALPRYYKQKIYTEDEQRKQALLSKANAEENDYRNRLEYITTHGTEEGFDRQVESGQRQRYQLHRKNGLNDRKL